MTQGEGRLESLASTLAAHGFSVTHTPLIRTESLPPERVRPEARTLLASDWLLFTSQTAVSAWAALELPLSGSAPKIGVVGEKTREAVVGRGGSVALVAQPANAQGLLETFFAHVTEPVRVGLPCGEDALPTLSDGLEAAGFFVERVPLYRTVPQPLTCLDADIVVLASPSAVAGLPQSVPSGTRFVALGPSTHQALSARGLSAIVCTTPDVHGVVDAVARTVTSLNVRGVELET